jgi:hypothetical protein
MKAIALLTCFVTFSAFAETKVSIPAKELLKTTRTLVAQSGPYYFVTGNLFCTRIDSGWSKAVSTCEVTVNGSTVEMKNPAALIAAVSKSLPPSGPYFEFSGMFEAISSSSETPPYAVTETATLYLP